MFFALLNIALTGPLYAQDDKAANVELGKKLKAAVKSGELTEKEAVAKYDEATKSAKTKSKPVAKAVKKSTYLDDLAEKLKAAVKAGKLTEAEALAKYNVAAKSSKNNYRIRFGMLRFEMF